MYWTDWGQVATIEKSSMDGRNRSVIHNTSLVWPNGLALDFQNQVLYWADAFLDKLESSNVDGSNRRIIITFTADLHPFGLALFDGILYFTDWSEASVRSVDPRNGNLTNITHGLYGRPFGIRAVSEQRQPIG
jgi:low density lipoprotein receptor-related protein 5/6